MNKSKLNNIERDLTEGLAGFVADLKQSAVIPAKYTSSRVMLDLQPHTFTPDQVKTTRRLLGASQSLFAQFLGVSSGTVAAWEQGAKSPQDVACRFMDEIQRDPKYWRDRLTQLIRSKPVSQ